MPPAGATNGIWTHLGRVGAGLVTIAIAGLVGMAVAQGKLETRVETTEKELDERASKVDAIPVIQKDIEHIRGDIKEIKDGQKEILIEIRKR